MDGKGIFAVDGQVADIAGIVAYWFLTGETDMARLRSAWTARGLDPTLLPEDPSAESALRRAATAVVTDGLLVRPLKGKRGRYAFVRETRTDDAVRHEFIGRVELEEGTDLLAFYGADGLSRTSLWMARDATGTDIAARVGDEFTAALGRFSHQAVSSWLIDRVFGLHAVSLRSAGGVYFVPRDHRAAWETMVAAVREASDHQIYAIPAMRSDEAVDAILAAVTRDAEDAAANLEADLANSQEFGERALRSKARHAESAGVKVASYEALLGKNLDALRDRLATINAKLAEAALVAAAAQDA